MRWTKFCWILLFSRIVLFVFWDVAVNKILLNSVVSAYSVLHNRNFGRKRTLSRGGTSGSNRGPAAWTRGSTQAHKGRNRSFQQRPRIKDDNAAWQSFFYRGIGDRWDGENFDRGTGDRWDWQNFLPLPCSCGREQGRGALGQCVKSNFWASMHGIFQFFKFWNSCA